jgi:hypothetical protein
MSDRSFYEVECVVLTTLVAGLVLAWMVRRLTRRRPGLHIGIPIAAAFAVRILAASAVSQLGFASALRGGDETIFTQFGRAIGESSFGSDLWTKAVTSGLAQGGLHEDVFAVQFKLLDSPDFALRVTQAGIAVAGLCLLAAAVYDLAGPRAALIAAWLLALEPSNVFFSTLLHKEALVLLAEGLVVYGGALLWRRGSLHPLVLMTAGCLVALGTRPYVAWFLIAAAAAVTLHAAFRMRERNEIASLGLASVVVLLLVASAPFALSKSSDNSLRQLQGTQDVNATDESNLRLERVDYSSRTDVLLHLPRRVRDILVRPYPWQVGNARQQLGASGTLFAVAIMALLAQAAWQRRGRVMDRAGPLVYVALGQLVAYALTVGNAGTGFRYRTHLVALGICLFMTLREQPAEAPVAEPEPPVGEPVPVPS